MLRSFQDFVKALTLFPSKNEAVYVPRKTIGNDYDKLFSIIRKGHHGKDEDVAKELYPANDAKALTRYFTTKSRLKDRIESAFFFLDTEKMLPAEADEYGLWKEMLLVWVFLRIGANETALFRLEKLLETAQRLGLTDIELMTLERIRDIHAEAGSMLLAKKFHTLAGAVLERKSVEFRLRGALAEADVHKARETLLPDTLREYCEKTVKASQNLHSASPTLQTRILLAKAECFAAEARGSYGAAMRTLTNLTDDLQRTYSYDLDSTIAKQQLPYALALRDAKGSEAALRRALKGLHPEMPETLRAYEYAFVTAFQANAWQTAQTLWLEALKTPAFERFSDTDIHVRWRLYEVYLRFFLPQREQDFRPTLFKPRFAATKVSEEILQFASNAPTFNTEHLRISLAIAELMRSASLGKTEDFKRTVQILLSFQEKYLRKDAPNYRLQCWLRMLETAQTVNFDYDETVQKTSKYTERLTDARVWDTVRLQTLELLPYDHAWKLVLRTLKHLHAAPSAPLSPFEVLRTAE